MVKVASRAAAVSGWMRPGSSGQYHWINAHRMDLMVLRDLPLSDPLRFVTRFFLKGIGATLHI